VVLGMVVVCRVKQKYWDVVAKNNVVDEAESVDSEVGWCGHGGFDGFSRN